MSEEYHYRKLRRGVEYVSGRHPPVEQGPVRGGAAAPGRRPTPLPMLEPDPPPEDLWQEVSQQLRANTRQFERVSQELATIHQAPPQAAQSEERLNNVELAVAKVKPWKTLLGFLGILAVGGVTVWTALGNYAKEQVLDTVKAAHADPENPIEPSVKTVTEMNANVEQANVAADYLFRQKELDVKIQDIEIELEIHRQQHQERLQDWSALKAARRTTKEKPIKTDGHVALEAKLKRLHKKQVDLRPKKPEDLKPKEGGT